MLYLPFEQLLSEPIRNGLTKPKAIRGHGVKMIAMGEIFAHSRIGNIEMDRVPVNDKEFANCSICEGDLLFARQSLTLEGAGKCSIVSKVDESTVFESHLIRARVDNQKANPYFIFYYFNSHVGRENCQTKLLTVEKQPFYSCLLVVANLLSMVMIDFFCCSAISANCAAPPQEWVMYVTT